MAEVEIHTGHHAHENDPLAPRVGLLVGLLGILLTVVTIAAHRSHTDAIIYKTEANDQWAYYQAKKIRGHTDAVAVAVLQALGATHAPGTLEPGIVEKLQAESKTYASSADEIEKTARDKDHENQLAEQRALRFDLSEGLLELGLVLSSLYFLARRKFFPVLGVVAAVIGSALGVAGFLVS